MLGLVTVTALGLHCWHMLQASTSQQKQSTLALASAGAQQIAAVSAPISSDGEMPEELVKQFHIWSQSIIGSSDVLAVSLRDGSGQAILTAPLGKKIRRLVSWMPTKSVFCESRSTAAFSSDPEPVWLASCPLGDLSNPQFRGSVAVVVGQPTRSAYLARGALAFGVPLAGTALLSSVLAFWWLERRFRPPLNDLCRGLDQDVEEWRKKLPLTQHSEVGVIAKQFADLIDERGDLLTELNRVRGAVETRIHHRTRKISTQLKQAEHRAFIDALTGLYNRRFLDEQVEDLFETQQRRNDELTIVMFDIDNFKTLNDTLGHAAGDGLLQFAGQLLKGSVRTGDLAVRYAGDEFVILLPGSKPEEAMQLTNRIVRMFAQQASVLSSNPKPSLSAGIASMRWSNATSGSSLLKTADAALYEAKRNGKNGVRMAQGTRKSPPPKRTAAASR